jgi:hypothetical protein
MQPSSDSASLPAASGPYGPSHQLEDRIYQAMTIAAMLMLLGSLWAF